jgi:hypothetical protein
MIDEKFSRRGIMQGAAALGTAVVMPQQLLAQQAPRTAGTLVVTARGELLGCTLQDSLALQTGESLAVP